MIREDLCSKCLKPLQLTKGYGAQLCYCEYIGDITDVLPASKSGGGTKHDDGKPQISLIPRVALEAEARVFGFGAKKYSRFNFKKGFKYSRLIDAALRHIVAFNDGEDLDPETKESHLAHARCCLSMLLDTIDLGTSEDDRFKRNKK